jgi:hypothetical protein
VRPIAQIAAFLEEKGQKPAYARSAGQEGGAPRVAVELRPVTKDCRRARSAGCLFRHKAPDRLLDAVQRLVLTSAVVRSNAAIASRTESLGRPRLWLERVSDCQRDVSGGLGGSISALCGPGCRIARSAHFNEHIAHLCHQARKIAVQLPHPNGNNANDNRKQGSEDVSHQWSRSRLSSFSNCAGRTAAVEFRAQERLEPLQAAGDVRHVTAHFCNLPPESCT